MQIVAFCVHVAVTVGVSSTFVSVGVTEAVGVGVSQGTTETVIWLTPHDTSVGHSPPELSAVEV